MGSVSRDVSGAQPERPRGSDVVAGRYRLHEPLGSGGTGSVFRALDEGTGRIVALKLLRSAEPAQRQLFTQEFQTLAKLAHPCVIRVFDHGQDDAGRLYYTMELLTGSDLMHAVPLPWRMGCELLRDVATSLALLHAQRLVHRDINPRNIRLTDDGRAKLLDFGALSPFGVPRELVGTPGCIAPEALRGAPLDARTDLFSLGVVAYWAFTGRLPYAMSSFHEAELSWKTQPLPPSSFAAAIPEGVDDLLLSLLCVELEGRPTSAADVIDRLGALAALDDEPLWSIAKSHVSSTTLVGRERALGKLQDVLMAGLRGHGTLLSIAGDPGTGKSRLLRELGIQAQLMGFSTVHLSLTANCQVEPLLQQLLHGLHGSAPREALASASFGAASLAHLLPAHSAGTAPLTGEVGEDHFEHERLLRMQLEVGRVVAQVAGQRALLVTIDDGDKLASSARGMLPILAHAALDRTLVVAVTHTGTADTAGADLTSLGEQISLCDLDGAALDSLLQNIFGDVPNRARLGAWLQKATHGNPGQVRDGLLHLLERRLVRYGGGAWLLPSEFADITLPAASGAFSRGKLRQLAAPTRDLLHILACHHGPLAREVCQRAVVDSGLALEQAERERLVLIDEDGVKLSHPSLRTELRAELSDADRGATHARLAAILTELYARPIELARRGKCPDLSIDEVIAVLGAGLHLLLSGRERAARLLLRNTAVDLTVRGQGLLRAAPALEEAIEHYRSVGAPRNRYAGLMTTLTLAGTYADWRLSYRYADETLDACVEVAGLRWAERLAPLLGKRMAMLVSLAVAFVLFMLIPQRRIANSFKSVLLGLTGLGTGAMSVCSVMMDPVRAQSIVGRLRALSFFPRNHPLREVHEYQLALADHTLGRYAEVRARSMETIAYLRSDAAIKAFPETARLQLDGGVLIALGQLDTCRTDGSIDQTLRDIERVQTATTQQTYAASRMSMHANRGERPAYLHWRERTDQLAAAGGATWRNDVQVPRMLWSTHALCEDVLTLKRDMEQLRFLAAQVPTVARLRDILNACYLCERGQPGEALALYEPVFWTVVGELGVRAAQQLGAYARILRKAGRVEDALQVCEESLGRLTPADMEFSLLVFNVQIERVRALTALAHTDRARDVLRELLALHAGHDNAMIRGLLHCAQAELELAVGAEPAFDEHAALARSWLAATQHPSLMAQYQRLMDRARGARDERALQRVLAGQDVSATDAAAPGLARNELTFETEDLTEP